MKITTGQKSTDHVVIAGAIVSVFAFLWEQYAGKPPFPAGIITSLTTIVLAIISHITDNDDGSEEDA